MADLFDTPSANRLHISFFGKRNAGKSSLVNAITSSSVSIVSDVKGTTTDPVKKAMELLPLGPVLIIDTPGFDDEGMLGNLRIEKTNEILNRTDIAVLVVDSRFGITEEDQSMLSLFSNRQIPYLVAWNKCDLVSAPVQDSHAVLVSAKTGEGIDALKQALASFQQAQKNPPHVLPGIVSNKDVILLVTPIDASAPKGRLILPQVQTIRDALDTHAITILTQVTELEETLLMLREPPKLVVTDSQVFSAVKEILPSSVLLTSFSILFAKMKGILETAVKGASALSNLKDGDKVLIAEGCTHHRQCEDIGTVKLPKWICTYTKKQLSFEWSSGSSFPKDLSPYALIIHCGGCMLPEKEMLFRKEQAEIYGVPFTNYGTVIAYMNGILKRSLMVFPEISSLLP